MNQCCAEREREKERKGERRESWFVEFTLCGAREIGKERERKGGDSGVRGER